MNDLVSIIMPNYNGEKFLSEALESVLAQTYPHWELLAVDDGSVDGSLPVLRNYSAKDERIRCVALGRRKGAAEARNVALRMARGRWIAFLDGDDLWHKEKLERQLGYMQEHGYAFSCCEYLLIDEAGIALGRIVSAPKRIGRREIEQYNYVGCLTAMYDARVVGLVQVNPRIARRNDYALWLQVCQKTPCYLLQEPLASYRIRKKSLSRVGILKLCKAHYQLFLLYGNRGRVGAFFHVLKNIFFGVLQKIFFRKKAPQKQNEYTRYALKAE